MLLRFVEAAEELIQHLKNENDKLNAEVNELRSEVASVMSSKDKQCAHCADYQKLLIEDSQKYKALSEEVTRLQNLQEGHFKGGNRDNIPTVSPRSAQFVAERISGNTTRMNTRKCSRESAAAAEDSIVTPDSANGKITTSCALTEDIPEKALSYANLSHVQLPECCKGSISENATDRGTCLLQDLIECLVGMKISTANQTEGLCISALHQSSGYSFSLTWVDKRGGEEAELVYRVSSLGTFERVAPEWMRDVIVFNTNMCPIFFERLTCVIKLHC
ncbi:uncharacterized protein LOC120168065 [Hibiscus syriacus]|uniref:uncharacterized protein LOC120168065 n=1 Tax=Hibiscus syriacus TaxID=106335 RepID=UPI001921BFCB|nr:uncharacterized protein LOC120168065 [Hibiscus syriacus]